MIVVVKGKQAHVITRLHEKHGPFVRIAPNEVSVCHPDAPKALLLGTLEKVSDSSIIQFHFPNLLTYT